MRYFDTGILLKLYLPEPRAAEAVAFVSSSANKPPINPFHELEIRSALRQKSGRGELTQSECNALIDQVESDFTNDVHERVTVSWLDVFATAETLSDAHGIMLLNTNIIIPSSCCFI